MLSEEMHTYWDASLSTRKTNALRKQLVRRMAKICLLTRPDQLRDAGQGVLQGLSSPRVDSRHRPATGGRSGLEPHRSRSRHRIGVPRVDRRRMVRLLYTALCPPKLTPASRIFDTDLIDSILQVRLTPPGRRSRADGLLDSAFVFPTFKSPQCEDWP
jgi:hypothetical protein